MKNLDCQNFWRSILKGKIARHFCQLLLARIRHTQSLLLYLTAPIQMFHSEDTMGCHWKLFEYKKPLEASGFAHFQIHQQHELLCMN